MKYGRSVTELYIRIGIFLLMIVVGGILSFGWSFGETLKVGQLVVGSKGLSLAMTIMIQYLPNVLLGFWGATSNKLQRILILCGAVLFNLINFWTNSLAYTRYFDSPAAIAIRNSSGFTGDIEGGLYYFGLLLCFLVTLYEEAALRMLSSVAHMVAEVMKAQKKKVPDWLWETEKRLRQAGTGGY